MVEVESPLNIVVVPAGGFGTANAKLAAENGHNVTLIFREEEQVTKFQQTQINDRLPGITLPETIQATTDLQAATEGAHLLIYAPSFEASEKITDDISQLDTSMFDVLSLSKWISKDGELVSERLRRIGLTKPQLAFLSGLNFAEPVARGEYAETVIASLGNAGSVARRAVAAESFVVFDSRDIVGVQLGGALKNVVAIAAGMVFDEKDPGRSEAVRRRGLRDMKTLGVKMGAQEVTFDGPSGEDDLKGTCTTSSRNFTAGIALGKGIDPAELGKPKNKNETTKEKTTVEGYWTAKGVLRLLYDYDVEDAATLRIVGQFLHEDLPLDEAQRMLLRAT